MGEGGGVGAFTLTACLTLAHYGPAETSSCKRGDVSLIDPGSVQLAPFTDRKMAALYLRFECCS